MTPHPTLRRPVAAALLALALALSLAPAHAASRQDAAMRALAERSGCTQCHAVQGAGSSLDEGLPVGPTWQEVAARYQGQRGVLPRLVRTVREGSDPAQAHWRGQVAGPAMPPRAVAISEADARRLVRWILAL